MEELTSYQVWQLEKYGNVLPETALPFSLDEDEVTVDNDVETPRSRV